MKTLYFIKSKVCKCNLITTAYMASFFFSIMVPVYPASAQPVLFDFDNAPLYTSLPINQTAGGITAHLAATGQGFSIQIVASSIGVTPQGFAGHSICPNSIYASDLLISFDQTLTDFSIMYACQELACDDAATMRVTAYMKGSYVGTNTRTATYPGTWPSDTLSCYFAAGFDSVVVHYDKRPPTCQNYGVIFVADNMVVTALSTAIANPNPFIEGLTIPNPVLHSPTISFSLFQSEHINISIYDITGRLVKNLYEDNLNAGEHQINWDVTADAIEGGMYFLRFTGENFSRSCKFVIVK